MPAPPKKKKGRRTVCGWGGFKKETKEKEARVFKIYVKTVMVAAGLRS